MSQVQDITERKKITESQRLVQLGRLLSDMAHEINNPLMIISGNAELSLMEGVKDPKIKGVLELILDECFLAEDIIQRLLKYSRLGKVEKAPVDLSKAVDLVTGILEHQFRTSNIEIEKHIEPGLPMVRANEKQLQEVFMNIIRNASDAMPDGGRITIRATRYRKFLKIDVADTGEGMSKKVLTRIFEPFFTTKQKGTGLGLAVCHSIMHEHGGDLIYDSKVGKGTTATILLPAIGSSRKKAHA
jgi:signal transduction histidine kinase